MSDSDFNTDPDLLRLVRKLAPGLRIGLDPCSNPYSLVNARTVYGVEEDGLTKKWRKHGLVFVNPPHSTSPNHIDPWIKKAVSEFRNCNEADSLILYVPAKTDTQWFHSFADLWTICFLEGRRKYWQYGSPMPGPGKFSQMVVYQGAFIDRFRETFCPLGWIP